MKTTNRFSLKLSLALSLILGLTCLSMGTASAQGRRGSATQRTAGQTQGVVSDQSATPGQTSRRRANTQRTTSGASNPTDPSQTPSSSMLFDRKANSGQRTAQGNTANANGTETETVDAGVTAPATQPTRPTGVRARGATAGGATNLGGDYIAKTTGVSGGRASGGVDAVVRGKKSGQSGGQLAGTELYISITRFISDSQLAQIESASQSGQLPQVLSNMNSGSVKIGNRTVTINAAIAVQSAKGSVVYLLSAQPFSTQGPQGGAGAAGAVGFIELRVGGGKGSMYTSTQVAVSNGAVIARGGASTATQLIITRPEASQQ